MTVSPASAWIQLLMEFLRIDSVSGSESAAAAFLKRLLAERFPEGVIERFDVDGDRWNVRIVSGDPKLTLTSHFDTVPGEVTVRERAGKIFGRGACDAKGQIIAQLWGLELAREKGIRDYCGHFVAGEEVDGAGARALVRFGPKTPFLLNGEPTGNRFASRSWGVFDVRLTAVGTAGHSSLGTSESAIHRILADLGRLAGVEDTGLSLNVGTISGGTASNVIAANAHAEVCVRCREPSAAGIDRIKKLLSHCAVDLPSEPLEPVDLYVPERERGDSIEVRFGSDCSTYAGNFEHVMLFGPGSIAQAHTEHEFVEIAALMDAAERISRLIVDLA